MKYDVVVVGAGPAGSFTASRIAMAGYKVGIVEEHDKIGEPSHCTGLITPRVLEISRIDRRVVQSSIYGADIYSPDGRCLRLRSKKIEAFSIDRVLFDQMLARRAEESGADIIKGCRVSDLRIRDGVTVSAKSNHGTVDISTRMVIGADGASSTVRRLLDMGEPEEFLYGYQAEFEVETENVEIFLGSRIAPGFFAWAVPAGRFTRIGLCTSSNKPPAGEFFERFINTPAMAEKTRNSRIVRRLAGLVPLGPKKTYRDNVMLVGDAAAQVKPTSGGGVYTGLVCAGECAGIAIEALEKNDFSEKFLSMYQRRWEERIGKELRLGTFFRKFFRRMSDETINKIFRKLDDPEIMEIISEYGDIDYPSKVGFQILKRKPGIIPSILFNPFKIVRAKTHA